jgi:hypothetical protein
MQKTSFGLLAGAANLAATAVVYAQSATPIEGNPSVVSFGLLASANATNAPWFRSPRARHWVERVVSPVTSMTIWV